MREIVERLMETHRLEEILSILTSENTVLSIKENIDPEYYKKPLCKEACEHAYSLLPESMQGKCELVHNFSAHEGNMYEDDNVSIASAQQHYCIKLNEYLIDYTIRQYGFHSIPQGDSPIVFTQDEGFEGKSYTYEDVHLTLYD